MASSLIRVNTSILTRAMNLSRLPKYAPLFVRWPPKWRFGSRFSGPLEPGAGVGVGSVEIGRAPRLRNGRRWEIRRGCAPSSKRGDRQRQEESSATAWGGQSLITCSAWNSGSGQTVGVLVAGTKPDR